MDKQRTVPLALPATGEEEWQALREPLESGWLTQGPQVAAFEQAFAERHRVPHALATSSGTTALHVILAAMGVGPGDEVIVPAFTWVATANVVLYCGARPVLVDVDPRTYNLDPRQLAGKIGPRTRAIVAVHLFGLCADMEAIAAAAPGIPIVEDAACAAGAAYRERPAGSLGLAAGFSFHPRKSITTGEGGMVTTGDAGLAARVAALRSHGAEVSAAQRAGGAKPYLMPEFNLLGFNYRMSDLQAAVGRVQLGKLDALIDERARWAALYRRELADLIWLALPEVSPQDRHAWQSFVCRVVPERAPLSRDGLMERLQERGVATRPGTHAVHRLGLYRERFGYRDEDFPGATDCDRYSMAIPLHNRMTEADYHHVVEALHGVV